MTKLIMKIFCFVLLISISCGNSEVTYTVEIIDDVRIVHNIAPAWGDEPKVELEFVQKIGDLESENENYALFHPMGIVKDAAGFIYIVDSGNFRVQKYDKDGNYIMTMGRQGEGPGEFARPVAIDLDLEGNLLIMDTRYSKIQKYSVMGDNLGSIRITSRLPFFRVLSTGEIVIPTSVQRTDKNLLSLFTILDQSGNILKEIGKPLKNTAYLSRTARFIAVDMQDNIFISYMSENRIEKFSKNGTKIFQTDH